MKKFILFTLLFFCFLLIWYGESRKFLCLDDGHCVTVWKTYNNVCYIIPGRYYGLLGPNRDHIQASNTMLIDIFFTKDLPNTMIFRGSASVKVKNDNPQELMFQDFYGDETRFREILYDNSNSKKLKDQVEFMFIDIHDAVAMGRDKRRLW